MRKKELKSSTNYKKLYASSFEFVQFPIKWCVRFGLSVLDVLIYKVIENYTLRRNFNCYSGSIKTLSSMMNVSLPTVRKSLEKLCERGFLRKHIGNRLQKGTNEVKSIVTYEALIFNKDSMVTFEEQLATNLVRIQALTH